MKYRMIALTGLLAAVSALGWTPPAWAGNSGVELGLQSFGDLSMFYQALLTTGVINDLDETGHYTIFAPVNTAFARIPLASYPCFYAAECRPQIASVLRDHIITGRHSLTDLISYGQGIQTAGVLRVRVEEPFVRDFAVDDHRILSRTDIGGNIIYRIDGVITSPEELAQFRTVRMVPVSDTVTTTKTVIEKTYHEPPAANTYPGGTMAPVDANGREEYPADDRSTTTIIRTTTTPSQSQ